ncbi:uncharacterized protein EI90DRAFT_3040179 [Cantharellus anzutake]|uniref:uncharacterized protein n=1 Tax=Cantharellus anzutake TaxID=1750568 RepID=UPI0019052B32|nr:uncharacterized protein EI90DRAFT_3040179 [Cantharellus anzutake]KAF8339060.1 hypothetical protein EI90DRAFT_3040179 [Cantharellus anzutake]
MADDAPTSGTAIRSGSMTTISSGITVSTRPRRPTRPPPPTPTEYPTPSVSEDVSRLPIDDSELFEDSRGASYTILMRPEHDASSVSEEQSLNMTDGSLIDDGRPHTHDNELTHIHEEPTEFAVEKTELTPLRAHYLKKALLTLEFNQELDYITSFTTSLPPNISTLSLFGPPFKPLPKDFFLSSSSSGPSQSLQGQPHIQTLRDIPFLRFMFRQFVLTFPFLSAAPKDFFPNKLQPFLDSLLSRNFSLSSDLYLYPTERELIERFSGSGGGGGGKPDEEKEGKEKMLGKLEKYMCLLLGAAMRLWEKEEVVRLTQGDLERLERRMRKRYEKKRGKGARNSGIFEVNIVCVRSVVEKRHVRKKNHDEFIIQTRRSGFDDIHVSRRYGDFRTFAEELSKHHPGVDLPSPPAKDRSSTTSGMTTNNNPVNNALRNAKSYPNLRENASASQDSLTSPLTPSTTPLQRERNRLTLRSYLHALLSHPNPTISSSPVLRAFLTMDPTNLSEEEKVDARRREELDRAREVGKKVFEEEVKERVERVRGGVRDVKGDLMGPDGLSEVFATVREVENAEDLPPRYRAVLEWGRISLASTIFHHFVASDTASESLAGLKRIHGLMPYFMMKGVLKISNPVVMIRGVMDLFMATPFGGKSLLQRMFTSSMTEEVKELEEEIQAVKDKVEDLILCEKVRNFVYAPKEIQDVYKADAAEENCNLLTVILRSPEEPTLNRPQWHRVARATKAHAVYVRQLEERDDSDEDEGPEDEDGWLYEDLGVLIRLYARLRDREQLIELVFEGTTSELLRDIITIFYSPLAQVYKAASIADSISDLQNFINDLIRTVEKGEEISQEDPSRTVQLFIDLVARHEQAFYSFVHKVHSKGEGLFDGLRKWIELFLTFVREGLGGGQERISLEFILPHAGKDREEILKEVDEVTLYHYKLKVAYEAKIRKRFQRQVGASIEEEQATQILADNVIGELQFGQLIKGHAEDVFAEDDDDDDEEDETSSDEYSNEDEDDETESESEGEGEGGSEMVTSSSGSASPESSSPSSRRSSTEVESPHDHIGGTPTSGGKPMPPIPDAQREPRLSNVDKPLPPPPSPSPSGHRRNGPDASAGSNLNGSQPGGYKLRKRRKVDQTVVEPPELRHIPKLLPIFVEMVSQFLTPIRISRS